MRALRFSLTIGCLLVIVGIALGEILLVQNDVPTIQEAIYAAVNGDTVLVGDGIWSGNGNRDIDFMGKAIVVMSENGPGNCIIDCGGGWSNHHRGFYFHRGEDSTSVVKGFTIRNGYTDYGGGILCSGSSPTITGNNITGNTCGNISIGGSGGGIHCGSGSPTIVGNTIGGNFAMDRGGGIYCSSGSSTIKNNTITGNSVYYFSGGGIYCGGSTVIVGNTISGNRAGALVSGYNSGGGGIYCSEFVVIEDNIIVANSTGQYGNGGGIHCYNNSSPLIRGNTIESNSTSEAGGGIYLRKKSHPRIENNRILDNEAITGGGLYCSRESDPSIEGNVITGNLSDWGGGGIYFFYSSPTLKSNTIVNNTAVWYGGGIYCDSGSSPTITNSILWGDSPGEIYVYSGNPVVTYSDVAGGWTGEGNIQRNPRFVDPQNGDYHLKFISPCIDAGDPDYVPEPGETDIDGEARIMRARIDMGSDEVPYPHYLIPAQW